MMESLPLVDDCWNRIGVKGDGTCPELTKVGHCHNCPTFARAGQSLFERPSPADYVAEWTRRLSETVQTSSEDTLAVLIFRIADEWLSLDVRSCVEVAPARGSHRVPHRSSKLFSGLVNIRGELHLGVSLRELLEIEEGSERDGRLLLVEYRRQRWVFSVGEVLGVQRLALDTLAPAPATVTRSRAAYTRGVFASEGRRIGLLDEDRIFEALKRNIG